MSATEKLRQEALLLSTELRREIVSSFPEVELHTHLASLFRAMNPDFWVEVTHGADEYGKDLVVLRTDPLITDVAGVVVKRGDIKGRTAGDVDALTQRAERALSAKGAAITEELLSQVRQAQRHTAELSTRIRDLKVNRVIVVLAGDMSNNARKRIQQEVSATGDVHDLGWLVESFTNYYPQVFFEARAVDYLYAAIEGMEADSFHSRSGKTLSECFVEPVIAPLDRELSLDDATHLVHIRKRRINFSQLASTVAQKRRVLLIGDPGSGKTKAVAKFCIDGYRAAVAKMTRRDNDGKAVGIPIIVPARRLLGIENPQELLDSLLPLAVRSRLTASTLVVDGLDEVASDVREPLLQKADSFATTLGTTLLVTSRRLAAFAAAPKGFSRFEILPFEVGQAMKLVRKVLVNQDVLPALKTGIETIQSQLPMNPLSLILLIEVVAERKEVPASITELYERFLDLVFGRWDQEKGLAVLFEYVVKKRFLARLAYEEFYTKGRLEMPAAEFETFLSAYAAEYGWDAEQLREFTKEIDRAGVLDTHEEVFFRHRSFVDFFVGYYMHENRDELDDIVGAIVRTYFDPIWMEAAFFYTGLSRKISSAQLTALFEYAPPEGTLAPEKLMIGRLLQAGWHSPTKTKERGVRTALEYLEGATDAMREFMKALHKQLPDFFAELLTLSLAEHSLGSFAVAKEGIDVLTEIAESGDLSRGALLKRAALLWALRQRVDLGQHQNAVRALVADVGKANLGPVDEARLLIIASMADPQADVRKIIGRRIRRIKTDAPAALGKLLPGRRPTFQPPEKVR